MLSMLLMLTLVLPAAAEIEPPVVEDCVAPGESITVEKLVALPPIPPDPDIYFMTDATGSMGGLIDAVADNADAMLAAIVAAQPTAQFGVGYYRDFPYDLYCFQHQQSITDDTDAVSDAIQLWSASGGGDGPEGQFYALTRLADPLDPEGIGWRSGPNKIVVWFGDAPAHDPVPMAATGLGYDINEATVTADLVAAGIKVVAISLSTGFYLSGLDDDPNVGGGDYNLAYGITENGSAGQASRIATATGGVYMFAATPEEAAAAVIELIESLTTDVWAEVTLCDPNLTVTIDPIVYFDCPGGITVPFKEEITVADDALECKTLKAMVTFYANSYPEDGAVIGEQKIIIHVDITPPEVMCVESVNPHGKTIPGEKAQGKGKGINPDGFYQLKAKDNCDAPEEIAIFVGTACDTMLFGPYTSGTVVKFTEAPGAAPSEKKIGSAMGQAGAVTWHITLPSEPIIKAVDTCGNMSECKTCFVPPPPK